MVQIRDGNFDNIGRIKASSLLYDIFHELRHAIYAVARKSNVEAQEEDAQIYAVRDVQDFYKENPGKLDTQDYDFIVDSNLGNPKDRAQARELMPNAEHNDKFYIDYKVGKDREVRGQEVYWTARLGAVADLVDTASQREQTRMVAEEAGYLDSHHGGYTAENMPEGTTKRRVYIRIDGSNGQRMIYKLHELVHVLSEVAVRENPKVAENLFKALTEEIKKSGDIYLQQSFDKVMAYLRSYGVSGMPLSRRNFEAQGVDMIKFLKSLSARLAQSNHVVGKEPGVKDKALDMIKKLSSKKAEEITDAELLVLYSLLEKTEQSKFGVMSELSAYLAPHLLAMIYGDVLNKEANKVNNTGIIRLAEDIKDNPALLNILLDHFVNIGLIDIQPANDGNNGGTNDGQVMSSPVATLDKENSIDKFWGEMQESLKFHWYFDVKV
ncbi:MAG: hypothetical protein COX51_02455, partial [Syntrophobacteraceae bacterium CG23_combo_of_CG06-09_8_20_14_all_50_8]